MRSRVLSVITTVTLGWLAACGGPLESQPPPPLPPESAAMPEAHQRKEAEPLTVVSDIDARVAKFAPIELDFDASSISDETKRVLKPLVEASQLMHQLFLRQIDEQNPALRARLAQDPSKTAALRYFDIMGGPWDGFEHDEPFVGSRKRLPGAGFYPEDMTKQEFEGLVSQHTDQKELWQGYFTVIARQDGKLVPVPYAKAYGDLLKPAAEKLRQAAKATKEPTLKKFLELRAEAFSSNKYRESDKAWMDVEGPIEVTIGPYETYADQLLGLKASFEAFVSLRDEAESKKLEVIGKKMDALERNLPMTAKQRAKMAARNKASPMDVVHLLCNAGQAGPQTVAFNLPNDEHVRKEKGSKKVMLKNVLQGKFERIVKPIAARVLAEDLQPHLNFDAMFSYILTHEVSHGLGPGIITRADGTKTEVNKELKELYSGIEEAKADIGGLVSAQYLVDKKIYPKAFDKQLYVAYLATVFRQVRFGVAEAHGRGAVASFNYLMEKGGITYDKKAERFGIDFRKLKKAVRELAAVYLTIEVEGDYEGAKKFFEKYASVSPEMKRALDGIGTQVPVDIAPKFTIYEKMKGW